MSVDVTGKSPAEVQAIIDAMAAENARLQATVNAPLRLKVSEKGAVSIYGLGRFPLTLYRSQMARVLDAADTIRQFMADNSARLSEKSTAKGE